MRFLVTAGNTREPIDSVRQWSNIFTGNTGFTIARALAEVGEVDLLTSNQQHIAMIAGRLPTKFELSAEAFTSHADLRMRLAERMATQDYQGVLMSAAVADYTPQRTYAVSSRTANPDGTESWIVRDVQAGKVKSTHKSIAILGTPTEKLIDLFRTEWRYKGWLVKFKLEVDIDERALLEVGRASRTGSGADLLVANTLAMVDGRAAGAFLIDARREEWVARAELPAAIVARALDALRG